MTICGHYRCVYIGDYGVECVHRLGLDDGATTQWPVNDQPHGLSVNKAHNVLVTCRRVRKIKEFSSDGNLLRELTLPGDVINPWHAIRLASGEFIVCHGGEEDTVRGVSKISADGRHIVHSQRGSATGQYYKPRHLAVDNNEFVFVVDQNNGRVTLLSPTLNNIRQVVSSNQLKGYRHRLCFDLQRRRLYVTDNEWLLGTSGQVVVFSV